MLLYLGFIGKIIFFNFVFILHLCPGNGFYRTSAETCYSDRICQHEMRCDTKCRQIWHNTGGCFLRSPNGYKPPVMHFCPKNHLTVLVHKNENIGYMPDLGILAEDWCGDPLHVSYSKREISHCNCSYPFEDVYASTKDKYGRWGSCLITVLVKDNYPPVFTHCPKDHTFTSTERVIWQNPVVTDNVGLRELNPPAYHNNVGFEPGLYNMTYEAIDWGGNKAHCTFRISVIDAGDEGVSEGVSKSTLVITGTLVGVLFIILVVMTIAMFLLCRKLHQFGNCTCSQSSRTGMILSQTNLTEDDHVFTIDNNGPAPYERLLNYSPQETSTYAGIGQQNGQCEENLSFSCSDARPNLVVENQAASHVHGSYSSVASSPSSSAAYDNYLLTNPQGMPIQV